MLINLVAAGCGQVDRFNDPYLSNKSGVALSISYLHNGKTTPMDITAQDGETVPLSDFREGCSDGTLFALDPAGKEIARLETPLCAGDIWTVGTADSPSP